MANTPVNKSAFTKKQERKIQRAKFLRSKPEPEGRNAILTADPILRQLFTIVYQENISVAQLGKQIRRTPQAISSWKKGYTNPTMLDLQSFAEAIGYKIVLQKKDE